MRPLRLTISGFTAFRDEQVIDFEPLDLFAITGPTGSGKSSILDAMTCALYGKADRVGAGVRQFISLGQPRASVSLEFAVGEARYRVTRRMSATATKILLEREVDGDWRQYGEGADRVRSVDDEIERLVGLDYAGFTRAVLLPQGRFAEFLSGDAKERRKILTDLLDLGLFSRLATRAGETAKEAKVRSDTTRSLLEREYAGVTPAALDETRLAQTAAANRLVLVADIQEGIAALSARDAQGRAAMTEVRRAAGEAERVRKALEARARGLRELVSTAKDAQRVVATAQKALEAAQANLAAASALRTATEERFGGMEGLAAARSAADGLVREEATGRDLVRRRREREDQVMALQKVLEAARATDAEADARARTSQEAALSARAALERAQMDFRVAALSEGLAVGAPCPVCDRVLESAPAHAHAPDLKSARAGSEEATSAADSAATAAREAGMAVEKAVLRIDAERRSIDGFVADQAASAARAAEHRAALDLHFSGAVPDDPSVAIASRIAELDALAKAEVAARSEAETSRRALETTERTREAVAGQVREARAHLMGELAALRAIAADGAGEDAALPGPPGELVAIAEAGSVTAGELSSALAERALELDAAATKLVADTKALVAPLALDMAGAVSVPDIGRAVAGARTAAERAGATAESRVKDLVDRLARRLEMETDLAATERRGRLYSTLAGELRGDRIVTFLQEEALGVLADAGSEHLAGLSDGRYRLEVVDDDFLVVDGWNGDERRSVRTLSGGETFLASLALARALSEQVSTLSSGGRARLESLFLDEGFGTLDPDSLELVIGAISSLGSDGRLVGVVTHVRELAERLPSRIEVVKSSRGSRIQTDISTISSHVHPVSR